MNDTLGTVAVASAACSVSTLNLAIQMHQMGIMEVDGKTGIDLGWPQFMVFWASASLCFLTVISLIFMVMGNSITDPNSWTQNLLPAAAGVSIFLLVYSFLTYWRSVYRSSLRE